MLTPVHIATSASFSLAAARVFHIDFGISDAAILLCAELIDLDHLFARPVYEKKRNSFRTHLLHKQWKLILAIAIAMLTIRPLFFGGIGIIFHLTLDLVYNKVHKL